jgi:cobalamin biosynthesis Mg chelatase CobN
MDWRGFMKYKYFVLMLLLTTSSLSINAGMLFDDNEKEVETSFKLAGSLLGMAAACNLSAQEDLIYKALQGYIKEEKVLSRYSELKAKYFISILSAQTEARKEGLVNSRQKVYRLTCKKINSTTLPHFKACIYGRNIENCSRPDLFDFF